jgi:hypothetical protein
MWPAKVDGRGFNRKHADLLRISYDSCEGHGRIVSANVFNLSASALRPASHGKGLI